MTELADRARDNAAAYAHGHDRPVGSFAGIVATYGATAVGLGLLMRRRGLPRRIDLRDLALAGVATHKLSRVIAKDPVTSPLRAPFTRFTGETTGPAELDEEVRGGGVRHALGELLECPFCVGQWVSTGFVAGLVLAPRATRVVIGVFASLALADFLQFAHVAAEKADG